MNKYIEEKIKELEEREGYGYGRVSNTLRGVFCNDSNERPASRRRSITEGFVEYLVGNSGDTDKDWDFKFAESLDPKILHWFSCDNADRMLYLVKDKSKKTIQQCIRAVKVKRKWILGKVSTKWLCRVRREIFKYEDRGCSYSRELNSVISGTALAMFDFDDSEMSARGAYMTSCASLFINEDDKFDWHMDHLRFLNWAFNDMYGERLFMFIHDGNFNYNEMKNEWRSIRDKIGVEQ